MWYAPVTSGHISPSAWKQVLVQKVAPIISLIVFFAGIAWTIEHAALEFGWSRPHLPAQFRASPIQSKPVDVAPPVPSPVFKDRKVALLIEDRPLPLLAPLVLHFIVALPQDWSIRFVGTPSSIAELTRSSAIRHHVQSTKVKITPIPNNTSIASQELISRFMTTMWLWDEVLSPAKSVLVFQTDSIICLNAHQSIDHFLQWDWIGAPWRKKNRLGGNGGLSLRNRDAMVEILRKEKRVDGDDFEDVWFTKRLQKNKRRKIANRNKALEWSGESQIPDDLLQEFNKGVKGKPDPRTRFEPVGYHIGYSGNQFHTNIWGTKELRDHIYSYCPEIKMLLAMDAAPYVPGECHSSWIWGKEPPKAEAEPSKSQPLQKLESAPESPS